jgi:hypothetical protein
MVQVAFPSPNVHAPNAPDPGSGTTRLPWSRIVSSDPDSDNVSLLRSSGSPVYWTAATSGPPKGKSISV